MEVSELRDVAFSTWAVLMTTLGEEDIESLIDQTFSIVTQSWNVFRPSTQQLAFEMIQDLFKNHSNLVRNVVNTIPSLESIPLMSKFEAELGKLKAQMDIKHQYQAFIRRCENESVTVLVQALTELIPFLEKNQNFLHTSAVSEQPDPVIAELTHSVLDVCIRFNESREDITTLCAQCLGLIGCLDPSKIETVREKREVLVTSNFERADETINFIVYFLQEVLVKAFLSTTNTKAQGFLAYAMQQFLKFCDLGSGATFRPQDMQSTDKYRRWIALPESVRNTLTPFLSSKYIITATVLNAECNYPIFTPTMTYGTWIRSLVLDLLQKGTGENVQMIFPVCSRIIRAQDLSIPNFLLPFTALNIIVGGSKREAEQLKCEIITVLQQLLPSDSHVARETLIACSQVRLSKTCFPTLITTDFAIERIPGARLSFAMDAREKEATNGQRWSAAHRC